MMERWKNERRGGRRPPGGVEAVHSNTPKLQHSRKGAATASRRSNSGQAMIEFIIALISILVLFAGLMQLVSLGNARTDAMLEARRRAGINSLAGAIGGTAPEYIKDWEKGPDETSYSADDELERGNMGMFTIGIANYAKPDDLRDRVGQNMLTSTAADPGMLMINYQEGRASRTVQLLPVIRGMVYDADSIEIECEVWMPESGGLY